MEALRRRLVRLAFDVHDGPMQSLTVVGYGLHEVERALSESRLEPAEAEPLLARIAGLLGELTAADEALRRLITTLEGGHPEIEPVDEIVAREVARFERRCPISVEVASPRGILPDTHSQALAIQAVLREALTNVAKHAGAGRVAVRVETGAAGVLLEVEDDGRGFEPDTVGSESIGLTSMRERIRFLGGDFCILTRPGGPTTVTALLRRWRKPQEGRAARGGDSVDEPAPSLPTGG